jgi:hypothetical protein
LPHPLVGKAGGTLRTGRQVDFKKGTSVGDLYIAMLDRMGAKVESFGTGAAPLPDLS